MLTAWIELGCSWNFCLTHSHIARGKQRYDGVHDSRCVLIALNCLFYPGTLQEPLLNSRWSRNSEWTWHHVFFLRPWCHYALRTPFDHTPNQFCKEIVKFFEYPMLLYFNSRGQTRGKTFSDILPVSCLLTLTWTKTSPFSQIQDLCFRCTYSLCS